MCCRLGQTEGKLGMPGSRVAVLLAARGESGSWRVGTEVI